MKFPVFIVSWHFLFFFSLDVEQKYLRYSVEERSERREERIRNGGKGDSMMLFCLRLWYLYLFVRRSIYYHENITFYCIVALFFRFKLIENTIFRQDQTEMAGNKD